MVVGEDMEQDNNYYGDDSMGDSMGDSNNIGISIWHTNKQKIDLPKEPL